MSPEPREVPLWRSMLFVPVLNERFVAGASRRGADAIVLDLEDSISPELKRSARAAVAQAAGSLEGSGADILVRINRPWRLAVPDLELVVGPHVAALALPKVPDAAYIRAIGEILDDLEVERGLAHGHTRLVAMIETAEGLLNIADIAHASPRLVGLTIGAEDLAFSLGTAPDAEALYVPSTQAVIASRAAGILPIGIIGSIAQYADAEAFAESARRARGLGFEGGFCIHPDQVPILNKAFSPTASEIAEAEDLIEAFGQAPQQGRGAFAFRGRMVDRPVIARAEETLRRHRIIGEREAPR